MKFYYLQKGDYLQLDDEYLDKDNSTWKRISKEYIGRKYGYTSDGQAAKWPRMRRLVPDGFELRKREVAVPIQEQYGEEFEH